MAVLKVFNPTTSQWEVVAANRADAVSIEDDGDYFSGVEVESALQELGAGVGIFDIDSPLNGDLLRYDSLTEKWKNFTFDPGAYKLSAFAATTSAELAGVISDETGSGSLVFSEDPTFGRILVSKNQTDPASDGYTVKATGLVEYTGAETASESFCGFTSGQNLLINSGHINSSTICGTSFSIFRNNVAADSDDDGQMAWLIGGRFYVGHNNVNSSATPFSQNIIGGQFRLYHRTGTATTIYGFHIPNIDGSGTYTNFYPIYQQQTDGQNFFGADSYFDGNVSADSFTDRTPGYEGKGVSDLKKIKSKDKLGGGKEIDHATLPDFAKKTKTMRRIVGEDENGNPVLGDIETIEMRDIGAMVSILTQAIKELDERLDAVEKKKQITEDA